MRRAHRDHDHRTAAIRPSSGCCVRNRPKLSHPVPATPRGCQPTGVPGPAQHIRCQSGAAAGRWGAHPRALAPSPLRRVAGPARRRRVPASGHVVAGLAAGLRDSGPDAGDPAESPGHKPPSLAADPWARIRACSYHASPWASQCNDLWINLGTISMNAQANRYMAVDARGCGNVDNRTAQFSQAAERQGGGRSPGLRSGVVVGNLDLDVGAHGHRSSRFRSSSRITPGPSGLDFGGAITSPLSIHGSSEIEARPPPGWRRQTRASRVRAAAPCWRGS
jgi:hypothetical protein